MTYKEIRTRLTSCENKLKQLQNSDMPVKNSKNYKVAIEKLQILKESLEKQLLEADKTAFINGQPAEYSDEKELAKFKDNPDVKSIKTATGKKIKEQEGAKFTVDETKSIAKAVGKAVAKSLHSLGDEVAHMKAKNIEENSFEIYVEYKNESDDQFSFYITDDTLHLVDFSFDKEIGDVGVKPSGEAVVHVDVIANELQKHFKSLSEKVEGDDHHYIKVPKAQYKKAMSILDNNTEPSYVKMDVVDDDGAGNVVIYFQFNEFSDDFNVEEREAFMYDAVMDLQAQGLDIADHSAELDEASDNLEEGEEQHHIYGRPVQVNKGENSDGTDWTVTFLTDTNMAKKGKTVPLHAVLALIEPKPEVTAHEGVDTQVDGGDLDIGHQDDEPNMLKKDLYDVITYAAKLYKQLDKYDQHDGEVDFPHWWQKKVTLAREYMSAAQHYLEGEEKQPAIDQLALEAQSHPVMVQQRIAHAKKAKEKEDKFHTKLDKLVHKTFGQSSDEKKKTVKEDWGGSDQRAMNQQIHKALGEPTKMPSPFDDKLEYAVQDAVDFHWDDWPEYQQDREGLYTQAKRAYLRAMFRDTFDKMVRMFEPVEEVNEDRFLAASMDDLEQVIRNIAHTGGMSEDDAIELAIRKLEAMLDGRDDMDEGVAKTKKAYDLVVTKMKDLAKQYKAGDTSVIGQLKDLTAKKKQLEKMLDKDVAGINRDQELSELFGAKLNYDEIIGPIVKKFHDLKKYVSKKEPDAMEDLQKVIRAFEIFDEKMAYGTHMELEEEKATYCGACGKTHKKSQSCPK